MRKDTLVKEHTIWYYIGIASVYASILGTLLSIVHFARKIYRAL